MDIFRAKNIANINIDILKREVCSLSAQNIDKSAKKGGLLFSPLFLSIFLSAHLSAQTINILILDIFMAI